MNPFGGQIPDIPPVKELWKNEKDKYRVWMILFAIGIITILGLMITSIIMTQISGAKDEIIRQWKNYIGPAGPGGNLSPAGVTNSANQSYNWNQTIVPSIMIGMVGIGTMLFLTTIIKSYQKKNFAFVSNWATFSIGMGAMMGFIQLIRQAWPPHLVTPTGTAGGIMMMATYILFIVIWALISTPVVRIRKTFIMSMRIEAIKNDPRYQEMSANVGSQMQQGPFGMSPQSMGQPMGQPMGTQQVKPPTAPKPKTKADKRKEELENMTVTELKKVALQLSISGHKEMRKVELISAIMRVSGK